MQRMKKDSRTVHKNKKVTAQCKTKQTEERHNRDEIRSANLALISGRQMHRINACIFLVAITKKGT